MPNRDQLTPRERWLAALQRQPTDRTPTDYWATPEFDRQLVTALGCRDRWEALQRLGVDFAFGVWHQYVGPPLAKDCDEFGCRHRTVTYGSGAYAEVITHPLAGFRSVAEIEAAYTFPSPDWYSYAHLPEAIRRFPQHPLRGGGSEPFLTYCNLRGQEQAMIDLVENPEIVEYCLGRLFDLAYETTRRIYETIPGKVLLTYIAEDMGAQTDLLFSPRHIRRFLFPGMKRMIDLAHAAGAYVFHHNDGNITRILPELVELGIDILNPIQWRAVGMHRQYLKQTYGSRIVFHGAMDNQHTLPFGTVDEVRAEVRENIAILGAGGGYILAPCHNIQPNTPVENVLAMYAEAQAVRE